MRGTVAKRLRRIAYGKGAPTRTDEGYSQTNKTNHLYPTKDMPSAVIQKFVKNGAKIIKENGKEFISILTATLVSGGARFLYKQLKKDYKARA